MTTTPCQCPLAGYCDRHAMQKIGRLHHLCQTDLRYFELWEKQAANEAKQIDPAKAARRERVRAAVERDRRLIGWIQLLRLPHDRGIGDTAHRLCLRACKSPDASAQLQRLLKQCSCSRTDAVARLNREWPYSIP